MWDVTFQMERIARREEVLLATKLESQLPLFADDDLLTSIDHRFYLTALAAGLNRELVRLHARVHQRLGDLLDRDVLRRKLTRSIEEKNAILKSVYGAETLDLEQIIEEYVEKDRGVAEIIAMGHDEATVKRVVRMIDVNEYKRRQSPPGVKITPKAFGRDRRLPIAHRYRGL